jgi:glycosyltransferase involved in cell wall biosynthesis
MVFRSIAYENTYDATIARINQFVNVEHRPAITFIIPTSDQTKLLRTLRSILSQTKNDWRAIIVFYGCVPTDETVLSILQDSRFLYMSIKRSDTHYVNGQLGYIRNMGLRFVSNSTWVGFIDEGDTIISTYCQRLEDEENYASSADAIIFKMKCGNDVFPPENYHQITQHLVGISFVIRATLLTEGYVFKPSSSEDFTFLFDLQRKFKTIAFSKIIAYYVKEDAPYSTQTDYTPRYMLNLKV